MVDVALQGLSRLFSGNCMPHSGRPSIAPEKLLRALLLQVLYSIRSERMLMEATGIQPVVPLVCRTERGRAGVGSRRCSARIGIGCWKATSRRSSSSRSSSRRAPRSAVGRAFHCGWHADRGLGEPEELSTQGPANHRRRMIRATRRSTFTARSAATIRMHRRPTRRRGWRARVPAMNRSWPTAATC